MLRRSGNGIWPNATLDGSRVQGVWRASCALAGLVKTWRPGVILPSPPPAIADIIRRAVEHDCELRVAAQAEAITIAGGVESNCFN